MHPRRRRYLPGAESLEGRSLAGGFWYDKNDPPTTMAFAESSALFTGLDGRTDTPDPDAEALGTGSQNESDAPWTQRDAAGNPVLIAREFNDVETTLVAPQVQGVANDTRPLSVDTFTMFVNHTGTDTVGNPTAVVQSIGGTHTYQETAASGHQTLVIGQDTAVAQDGPGVFMHVSFHIDFETEDMTNFWSTFAVEVHIGNLVSIYANSGIGYLVNGPDYGIDDQDPSFGTTDDSNASFGADYMVHQGDAMTVDSWSDLQTGPAGDVPAGAFLTNDSTLSWSLDLSFQPNP